MAADERSPIKDRVLRHPGQSLDEQRLNVAFDGVVVPMITATALVAVVVSDWIRYYSPRVSPPWLLTVVAAASLVWAAWRMRRAYLQTQKLRLGAEGERAVGQYLEGLRSMGYRVFHDLQAEGFNVDLVLIGPAGVFAIETKTWSKPTRGDARIAYDGQTLKSSYGEPDRDPLVQAKAQARWVALTLEASTVRPVAVRPVVVFPGWYVAAAPGSQQEVWVMEPKGLPAFLAREPERLDAEAVSLVAFHLSRYIRAAEAERAAKA